MWKWLQGQENSTCYMSPDIAECSLTENLAENRWFKKILTEQKHQKSPFCPRESFQMIQSLEHLRTESLWEAEVRCHRTPILTHSNQVLEVLQHHVFVKIFLGRVQQSPFFRSEMYIHIIICHCILK